MSTKENTKENTFAHGEDCCAMNCTNKPLGGIGCFTTFCCPCFVFCANSEKVDDLGVLYAVLGFIPFGNCISTTLLGMHVEEKRGLKEHGCMWHGVNACFNPCTCHSCRVVNECKIYEAQGAAVVPAPKTSKMERK